MENLEIRYQLFSGEWIHIEKAAPTWIKAINLLRQEAEEEWVNYYDIIYRAYDPHGYFPFLFLWAQGKLGQLSAIRDDIVERLGYRQGIMFEPQYEHFVRSFPKGHIIMGQYEAVDCLGIYMGELRELINNGEVKVLRIGNVILPYEDSVMEYKKKRDGQ